MFDGIISNSGLFTTDKYLATPRAPSRAIANSRFALGSTGAGGRRPAAEVAEREGGREEGRREAAVVGEREEGPREEGRREERPKEEGRAQTERERWGENARDSIL